MSTGRAATAIRAVAWALVFIAPAAAAASWFTPRPDLDRDDAVETALGALAEVDVDGQVSDDVTQAVHRTEEGDDIDVWVVPVDVDDEQIELRVQQAVGQLVYVDDRIGPDDTERLLTDEEFETMGRYRNDATADRWVRRNAAATVGAVLVAGASWFLVRRPPPPRREP